MVKRLIVLLSLFVLWGCANGQYNPDVVEYRIKAYTLSVVPNLVGFDAHTFPSDTTVQLSWRHYDNTDPAWVSPYGRSLHSILVIPNEEGLWGQWEGGVLIVGTDTTAYKTRTLALEVDNWYEFTITAFYNDTYSPRESGEARPFYVHVPAIPNKASIILEFRIE